MTVRQPTSRLALMLMPLLLVPTACGGGSGDDSGEAASEETFTMRIGNETAGDIQEELGQLFVDKVTEESGGRIEGEYFTAGALGANVEMLKSMQSGGLEGNIAPTAFMSTFVPELGALSLPFLYGGDTMEENIQNIGTLLNDGEAGQYIKDAAAEKGFRIISLFGIGPEVIYSSSPIEGLEDLRGNTYRVLPGEVHVQTFSDWGVEGASVPFGEVYTSVQQGVIDGGENPPDVLYKSGFHEVGPHIAETYHNSLVSYITVSEDWYKSLPADLQEVVDRVGQEMVEEGGQAYSEAQRASLEELMNTPSVTVTQFPEEDLEEMEQLNQAGVWEAVGADDALGPVVDLLLKDRENLQ